MTDHQRILEWLSDGDWHCSTELDYMRDARKRRSELNMGEKDEDKKRIQGIRCDSRCDKEHKSVTLLMWRINPNFAPDAIKRARLISSNMPQVRGQNPTNSEFSPKSRTEKAPIAVANPLFSFNSDYSLIEH